MFDQPAVNDHGMFMGGLTEQGFVLIAGPLAGSEHGRARILLIVEAADEAEIRRRLADDPWTHAQRLVIHSIEPWNLVVGAERLAAAPV
jgi:uncharacterized protein YciI